MRTSDRRLFAMMLAALACGACGTSSAQVAVVQAGASYLSAGPPVAHFGLGEAAGPRALRTAR